MASALPSFAALPVELQALIRRAERQHKITVTPLQALGGGWSGARLFLVSVASGSSGHIEHLILKLDRKTSRSRTDELARHSRVLALATPSFAEQHLPRLAYDRVEHDGNVAIFYAIAGHSLHGFRPLGLFERQAEAETLFVETYREVLEAWNAAPEFRQAVPPTEVLTAWLDFRVRPGNHIERFLRETAGVAPDLPGFLVEGAVYPNPLAFAQHPEWWGSARPLDVPFGMMHGDLNTGNVLARLAPAGDAVEGFYLIDFALFQEQMPLLYDLRYLEMSYLVLRRGNASPAAIASLIRSLGAADSHASPHVPIALAGLHAVLAAARRAFSAWVTTRHPSLADDLWGLYWLAGAAAGLAYCHKPALGAAERMLGLHYGAANLKQYLERFGVPLPSEARSLPGGDVKPAASSVDFGASSGLPAPPTPLVGRETETAAVRERLTQPGVRLMTLTGPGGTGKTRLALHVASEVQGQFADGVYFVPLADVREPARVLAEIARTLGLRDGGSMPLADSLAGHLRERAPLLVLDNFEQVTAAADKVATLLAAAPHLKVVVTSRIPLRLRGEHEYPVPPLRLPAEAETLTPEAIQETEAVRLFVARAQAAQPAFALTPANAVDVAAICRQLDGLPLAIELAAARTKLLPPTALRQRLSQGLALLSGGARDLPARHQALRATLDWSYDLLSPAEQILLSRLGVFAGGFTLEAAEAVCNPDGTLDVLTSLSGLIDNSLVQPAAENAGRARYRMLETIREYGLERLSAAGETEAIRRAHALYFVTEANVTVGYNLFIGEATRLLNLIEADYENVRDTLEWCLTHAEGQTHLPDLVMSLNWFWYRRGFVAEGRKISQRAVQALSGRTLARTAVVQNYALLLMWQGELTAALTAAREVLDLRLALEDEEGLPTAKMGLGVVLINMGRDDEAHPQLKEAREMFHDAGLAAFEAITLVHLGNVALGLGRPDEAEGWLNQGLALAREINEPWTISFAVNNLGEVARVRGDYAAARAFYAESEALLRATRDHADLARLIHNLGYTDVHLGDLAGAESRFAESLAYFKRLSNKRGLAECLAAFATVRALQGRAERAATLLGAAEAMLTTWGAAWWPADRVEIDRTRARLQAALGPDAFAAAHAAGQALEQETALHLALQSNG